MNEKLKTNKDIELRNTIRKYLIEITGIDLKINIP